MMIKKSLKLKIINMNLKQKLIATGLFNEAEFNYYYQPFDNNTYYWNDYSFQGATKTYMEMRYNLTGEFALLYNLQIRGKPQTFLHQQFPV